MSAVEVGAARHGQAGRGGDRVAFRFLRPVTAALQILQDAAVDPDRALRGQAVVGINAARHERIVRIGIDRHVFAEDIFAQARPAALLRGETTALVRGALVEFADQHAEQIGHRRGLEDHGVFAGRQPHRLLRAHRLVDRHRAHACDVHLAEIVVRRARPARAGAVRRARVTVCSTSVSLVVDEKPLAVGEARKRRADIQKARGLQIFRLRLLQHRLRSPPASMAEVADCVAAEKPVPVAYFCGPIGGMNSGFSGASFAVFSDAATSAASASSLRSVPEAEPDLLAEMRFDADLDSRSARRSSSPCSARSGRAAPRSRRS